MMKGMENISFHGQVLASVIITIGFLSAAYSLGSSSPEPVIAQQLSVLEEPTTYFPSSALYDYEVTAYPTSVEVVESGPVTETITIGLVSDKDNLKFGKVPAGNNFVRREVQLTNTLDTPAFVYAQSFGSISDFVELNGGGVVLEGGEGTTVTVDFATAGAEIGSYDGQIHIIVKRSKYPVLSSLMTR
jgi:hypothetical protein